MNSELRSNAGAEARACARAAPQGQRRLSFGWVLILLVVIALGSLAPGSGSAQQDFHAAEEIGDSRDRVLTDRYQTSRPEPQKPPEIEPFPIPDWLVEVVFWTVGAIVVGLMLFFLGNLILDLLRNPSALKRNRDRPAGHPAGPETPVTEGREAEQRTLAEADRLAAQGRFSEAIHLLLLVAMQRLRGELGPQIAPAMTSREVLRLASIPGEVVDPLKRMVAASEINHFGGRAAREPEYRACRDDFLRFNGLEPTAA